MAKKRDKLEIEYLKKQIVDALKDIDTPFPTSESIQASNDIGIANEDIMIGALVVVLDDGTVRRATSNDFDPNDPQANPYNRTFGIAACNAKRGQVIQVNLGTKYI